MERRPRPDVLFDHSRWQLAQSRWPALPAVTMIHGNAQIEPHARNVVFCSLAHGRWHGRPNPVALHNGIEPGDFRVGPPMNRRLGALWMGRIMPYKRPHLAVDLCERAGIPITVAGQAVDSSYFGAYMRPRIKPEGWADYVGEVAGNQRLLLLSQSACLLMTSEAQDPAPIVVIEAMASGTPVFAFDHGSTPEFILDGVSGLLMATEPNFVACLQERAWLRLDPAACRRHVEDHLSINAMAGKAEALLAQVADGGTW
jgi:glycosyltransferase involved in cell wall biosynthesis